MGGHAVPSYKGSCEFRVTQKKSSLNPSASSALPRETSKPPCLLVAEEVLGHSLVALGSICLRGLRQLLAVIHGVVRRAEGMAWHGDLRRGRLHSWLVALPDAAGVRLDTSTTVKSQSAFFQICLDKLLDFHSIKLFFLI